MLVNEVAVVAAERIIQPEFPNYVRGLPLYHAGQALLARSVASAAADKRRVTTA